jgi:hypothetical protein
MNRKIYAILFASLIIGAGEFIATAQQGESNQESPAYELRLSSEQKSISYSEHNKYIEKDTKINAESNPKNQLKTSDDNSEQLQVKSKLLYQKLSGQWGFMNNPISQGSITGYFNGRSLQGIINSDVSYTLILELHGETFSGDLLLLPSNAKQLNTNPIAIMSISGVYSVSNDYITAFWMKGSLEPNDFVSSPVYDGWFFGEIL